MHGGHRLLEGGDVGVDEVDPLLVLGLFLGGFHSVGPGFPLGLVQDLEALVKNGALLLAQAVHKAQVADQDIGDHLVHGVGVVFAHVAVAVVGQGQLVVLCAVQHLGLQGGVHIAKAHGGGRAAQQLHHPHVGGRLLDADLQAVQVRGGVDGGVDGVEVAGAGVQPGDGLEAGLLGGLKDGPHDVGVVHRGVVCLGAGEQVGQVEQSVVLRESLQQGVGRHAESDGAGLGQLDHLILGAQQLAGEDLDVVLVPQLAADELLEGQQSGVGGVVGGLVVSDADDLQSVAAGARAARQPAGCQSCHRRHE